MSDLVLGLKCGRSDTTQGLFATPAVGIVTDLVVAAGGTAVLGEVTEFIGAEHILVRHARTPEIGRQILALVDRMEARAKATGCDMRGGTHRGQHQRGALHDRGEVAGGHRQGGDAPRSRPSTNTASGPQVKGLVVMDSPGREPEILTGLAAAGCTLIAFATGRGAPQGFPFVPVVKITGNRVTWDKLRDHMDLYVGTIMEGSRRCRRPAAASSRSASRSPRDSSPRRRSLGIPTRWTST